jgi:6,7-dimethyl-8-ribityllumazine synthase
MARVLIIEARFYTHIADNLLRGVTTVLEAEKVDIDIIVVPGIYEIPAALELALESQRQGRITARYDGYVTLGCAIRGESDHYDHICGQTMRAIGDLSIANHLALGNGVLTVHNEAQALVRSDPARKDIGGMAARACLRMMEIKRDLML